METTAELAQRIVQNMHPYQVDHVQMIVDNNLTDEFVRHFKDAIYHRIINGT